MTVTVLIDPDGTSQSYLGVVVRRGTGVIYQHQCAGVECQLRSLEGYFVPLGGSHFRADEPGVTSALALRAPFHGVHNGCRYGGSSPQDRSALTPDRFERVRALVENIAVWTGPDEERTHLKLDQARIDQLREAWVPVVTPDGDGVLIWPNCD